MKCKRKTGLTETEDPIHNAQQAEKSLHLRPSKTDIVSITINDLKTPTWCPIHTARPFASHINAWRSVFVQGKISIIIHWTHQTTSPRPPSPWLSLCPCPILHPEHLLLINFKVLNNVAPLLSHRPPSPPFPYPLILTPWPPHQNQAPNPGGPSLRLWNSLSQHIRTPDSLQTFKSLQKTHLFNLAFP